MGFKVFFNHLDVRFMSPPYQGRHCFWESYRPRPDHSIKSFLNFLGYSLRALACSAGNR